jgi:hypothetical protein
MLDQVRTFLEHNPCTKAKTIASRLKVDRTELNRLLHDHVNIFEKDSDFAWSLLSTTCRIEFGGSGWMASKDFENAFPGISPLTSHHTAVVLVLKEGCKPLLEFLSRLLAFCNQLVAAKKNVTLDFEGSKKTLSYLDRVGFFNVLNASIDVLPERPSGGLSKTYEGKNDGVIEFRLIDHASPDKDIPSMLQHSFVSCAGASYSSAAFTVLAELFGNVLEHSNTASPGFACLQFYPGSRKIQAVISDNGLGIVGTLAPVVPQKYPIVAKLMAGAKHPGVALLTEVFKKGRLSQVDADGRGIGLKLSGDVAEKYRAKISVRQSDFELCVYYNKAGVQFSHRLNLTKLSGTHICFEFRLDVNAKSA